MKVVLLAAGKGSRLWPLSTPERPKQFHVLFGEQTMLQYTYDVFLRLVRASDIYILTLDGLEPLVHEQLPSVAKDHVLRVPERRNTLPHTLFALRKLAGTDDEAVLFTSTDNYISDEQQFLNDLRPFLDDSHSAQPTLLCAEATSADPKLGYAKVADDGTITAFIEKPDATTIRQMLSEGGIYKNSCIYRVSIAAIQKAFPAMDSNTVREIENYLEADNRNATSAFLAMTTMDISSAYFAHASNTKAYITESDIIDLGSFASLYTISDKDEHGNAITDSVQLKGDCKNNLIINRTDKPLTVTNSSGMVIVRTPWGSLDTPLPTI